MNIYDLVDSIAKVSLERSKKYNDGSENYAFAFEWLKSELQADLDQMGLTENQLKVLSARLNSLEKL